MRVRMLKQVDVGRGWERHALFPGQTYDVSDADARVLLDAGTAEREVSPMAEPQRAMRATR